MNGQRDLNGIVHAAQRHTLPQPATAQTVQGSPDQRAALRSSTEERQQLTGGRCAPEQCGGSPEWVRQTVQFRVDSFACVAARIASVGIGAFLVEPRLDGTFAAETGVSKPTIYLRWSSKAELAAAVSYMHVDQTLTLTGDVRRDLIGHLKRVQRVLDTVGTGLTGTVLASQSSNPALIAAFRQRAVRPSRQRVRRILQEGIRQGAIRPGVDVNAAVNLLVGALYAAYLAGEGPSFEAEAIVDTLLAGLGTDAAG